MTNSQNGWSVRPASMTTLIVDGVSCGGVRSGDVFTVLQYVATRYNAEVERLKAGQCGGYNDRSIAGSGTPSNHASATALDFNWHENPEHKRTMTAEERTACNRIVDDCEGVIRWGGNYAGSDVDEMHWEINKPAAAVAALAARIRAGDMPGGEEDMLIKKGDKGELVKFWQNVLTDLGYPVETDGDYGPKVEAAINKYRKDHGAGPLTYLTGWQAFAMLTGCMAKRSGKPGPIGPAGVAGKQGPAGPAGATGPAGPAGTLTGQLVVRGGTLDVQTGVET